jgi:hypothetical protein
MVDSVHIEQKLQICPPRTLVAIQRTLSCIGGNVRKAGIGVGGASPRRPSCRAHLPDSCHYVPVEDGPMDVGLGPT